MTKKTGVYPVFFSIGRRNTALFTKRMLPSVKNLFYFFLFSAIPFQESFQSYIGDTIHLR